MSRIHTFFAVLFLCASAWAAEPPSLTLEQIELAAQQSNPDIRAALRRVTLAAAGVPAAGALDDPMLTYRNWGTPLSRPYRWDESQQMFMLQQTFSSRGKRALRTEVAGQEVDLAKLEVEVLRRDISVRVRKAFYDLLRNAEELRIHNEQVALANQALQSASVKYTVGRVPQQDVLKAQIAVTRLAEHLVNVESDGEMLRAELNSLMGRDPATALEIAGKYREAAAIPALLDLQKTALEHRPELLALLKQQDIAETNTRLARKAYTPDVTLGAGYMLAPPGSMARNNYMLEFTTSLPWLNRKKNDAVIAQADTGIEVTRGDFERVRNEVFLQIQQALIRARAAQRLATLYRDTLKPQAEATFKAAAAAYQHDRTDFLNLIDSQNMLLDVQSSYFRTRAEYDARLAELERAIGAPLPRQAPAAAVTETEQ